ncbi:hypothetical protein IAD21_00276 [Abditibacteriota bacterium]|nr:hypothetical protein IAD21_00276 [Abditibacteriota bacterium]
MLLGLSLVALVAPTQKVAAASTASTHPQLALQIGHSSMVETVAYSPDGRELASGSSDNTIKLWDVQTGLLLRTLTGHTGIINSVAFSSDGRKLASGSMDNTIKLWNVQTGILLRTLTGHISSVDSVAFSRDARTIASGSWDKSIKLWDVETGRLKRTLIGHIGPIHSVAFSSDGRKLASGSMDTEIRLWDVETGRLLNSFSYGMGAWMRTVAFSHDGKRLAIGGKTSIQILDLKTGILQHTLDGHLLQINTITFSPDNRKLASSSPDQIRLWDVETGRLLNKFSDSPAPLVRPVAFSPNGAILASGNAYNTVTFWDVQKQKRIYTLGKHTNAIHAVVFSPDSRSLAVGSSDKTIKMWDMETGSLKRSLQGHTKSVHAVAFSPDGASLVSGSFVPDKSIKLWDSQTGNLRRTLSGHGGTVDSVVFSPDGKVLASGSFDGTIKLWDAQTGTLLRTLLHSSQSVLYSAKVVFSPDGKMVASGSDDGTIKFWDVATGSLLHTLKGHTDTIGAIDFSPDGRMLASGSHDRTIKLWNVQTGVLSYTLVGHASSVQSIDFSPDGKMLVSGDWEGNINLWKVETGALQHTLKGHIDIVESVSFSPDGRFLASGGYDATIRLWDPLTGHLLLTLLSLPESNRQGGGQAKGVIDLGEKDLTPGSNEWFAMTPQGWFDCSTNAANFVRWQVGNAIIPAERYWRRFRRPDLVRRALRREKVPEPDFTTKDMPPTTRFVGLSYDGRVEARSIGITLETRSRHEVKARDVVLLVNGRPLPPQQATPREIAASTSITPVSGGGASLATPDTQSMNLGKRAITLGEKAIVLGEKRVIDLGEKPITLGEKPGSSSMVQLDTRDSKVKQFTFQVPLPLGAKEVRLRAISYDISGLGSNWAEMIPLSRPKAQPVHGNLYVLSVGISLYKNADGKKFKNLKFAGADARDVTTRLQKEGKPLYQHVEVYRNAALLDGQATLPNIRAGLHWLQHKARPGQVDTVIVFLSGHGISDSQGKYSFPTCEFDPQNPRATSLSGEELQQELAGKLCAKNVFLFVDSCHSGGLTGEGNEDLNFEAKTSGVYMMASSGTTQSSYEYKGWGHGAFTLALLTSLQRQDLARNGAIRFNVLTYAVPNEISKLMLAAKQNPNEQEPVVPLEGRSLDEPVTQVRPWRNSKQQTSSR